LNGFSQSPAVWPWFGGYIWNSKFRWGAINMKSEDVTFVVQGPVIRGENGRDTGAVLKSIRRNFPGSTIVFSSEIGIDLDGLDIDEAVLGDDPGFSFEDEEKKTRNNLKRQILSASLGLSKVRTRYAVKTRSDILFQNDKLLRQLLLLTSRPPSSYNLGSGKIVCSNFTTVDPRSFLPFLHHPCDSLQAGFAEDVAALWSCPLPDGDFFDYMREGFSNLPGFTRKNIMRYRSEAWVWFNYVKPVLKSPFEHSLDFSLEGLEESLELFSRNLVVLSPWLLGVNSIKNKYGWRTRVKMMTHLNWVQIARAHGVPTKLQFDPDSLLIGVTKILITASGQSSIVGVPSPGVSRSANG
jgi:hypothetical protein